MQSVEAFRRKNGRCPYENYVEKLLRSGRKADAAKIDALVVLLARIGSQRLVQMRKAEKMNGVWQLRSGRHRVFYFLDGDRQTYILFNGFRKQSRKTPPSEVTKAEGLKREYLLSR